MTEDRQAVSERAIRWRVVRPWWSVGVGEAGEVEDGRWMRVRDWCITTTMKNVKATQNQRPHTVRGVSTGHWVLWFCAGEEGMGWIRVEFC